MDIPEMDLCFHGYYGIMFYGYYGSDAFMVIMVNMVIFMNFMKPKRWSKIGERNFLQKLKEAGKVKQKC
jgi:hypothetical protein